MNPLDLASQLMGTYDPDLGLTHKFSVDIDIDTIVVTVCVPDMEGHKIDWSLENVITAAWLNVAGVEAVDIHDHQYVHLTINLKEFGYCNWQTIKDEIYKVAVNLAVMCQLHTNALNRG